VKKIFAFVFIFLLSLGYSFSAVANNETGQIKICRHPRITEMMDGKQVNIPAGGMYSGVCDKHGENCRALEIKTNHGAALGRSKSSCVVLDATLIKGDGKPVKAGQELVTEFVIPGFTPKVIVVKGFGNPFSR
jgi:hypothetical protein